MAGDGSDVSRDVSRGVSSGVSRGVEGPAGATVAALGEDGLIGSVIARYAAPPPGVLVGPGDDAAVLDVPGRSVISTDTLVEGYDFLRTWSTAYDVGVKTAAQNLADVAAMGATPFALLVSLATPGDLPAAWARELADGLAAECARAGAAVVGGDVSQSGEIVITGTALGLLAGPVVLRSGARPGDVVALAGVTGPSAAGLALLRAGTDRVGTDRAGTDRVGTDRVGTDRVGTDRAGTEAVGQTVLAELVRAHLAPRPGYAAGPIAAAAGATAMIDTSDGLLRDARRVAEASGVVLDLDPQEILPGEDLRAAEAALLGRTSGTGVPTSATGASTGEPVTSGPATAGTPVSAVDWVLTGGEDHALLACFPPEVSLPGPFRRIGLVHAAQEAGVLVGGRVYGGPEGWRHFR